MPDYIPAAGADFNAWLSTFMSAPGTRGLALGVSAAEIEALQTARESWDTALGEHNELRVLAAVIRRLLLLTATIYLHQMVSRQTLLLQQS